MFTRIPDSWCQLRANLVEISKQRQHAGRMRQVFANARKLRPGLAIGQIGQPRASVGLARCFGCFGRLGIGCLLAVVAAFAPSAAAAAFAASLGWLETRLAQTTLNYLRLADCVFYVSR